MSWLRTCLVLLTMAAYALGLPMHVHQTEHERADRLRCACACLPIFRVSHGLPAMPTKQPAKAPCAVCIELHAMIAAADAPIVLVDAGTQLPRVFIQLPVRTPQSAAINLACRGPPSNA